MFRLYLQNTNNISLFRPEGVFSCALLKESVRLSRMMEISGSCRVDKIIDCRSISVISSSFMELYPFLERLRVQSEGRCARMVLLINPQQQELAYFIRMARNMLSHRTMKIQLTYDLNEACEWLNVEPPRGYLAEELLIDSGHCIHAG